MVDHRFAVSVHIMTAVACHHSNELMTSEHLAESIRTNPAVVRRLTARLAGAGLLDSFKGKFGGVRLAKESSKISLSDIYGAVVDDPLIKAPEKSPKKQCPVSCSMQSIFSKISSQLEKNFRDDLAKISLADLRRQVERPSTN